MACELERDYAGEQLHLVIVLNGAFVFAADLARELSIPLTIDFVRVESYNGFDTTGKVVMKKELEVPIAGRHVLVVEDIIDTGITLSYLLDRLRAQNPLTIRVCTLFDKPSRRKVKMIPDYVGISCADVFLVGYGLDLDGRYRELPAVYEVGSDITNPPGRP